MKPQTGPLGIARISEEGRRLSAIVSGTVVAHRDAVLARRAWIAARLSDGGTDGVVYPDKASAIRYQLHETLCAYVCVPLSGMPPAEATAYLDVNRKLYDAGARLADPDVTPDLSMMPRSWTR